MLAECAGGHALADQSDLKSLAFTVDGEPWDGNDLADPSALTWSGLPDGWTVADSTKDGIRTLAFTAPDGTVVRTVQVGTLYDADKPKTDKAADKTADSASAATASKPLVSTGVAIAGAVVGVVLLAAIGITLVMASRRKGDAKGTKKAAPGIRHGLRGRPSCSY